MTVQIKRNEQNNQTVINENQITISDCCGYDKECKIMTLSIYDEKDIELIKHTLLTLRRNGNE